MELTIISTSERRNHHVLKIFPGFCQNEYAQRAVNLPVVRSYSYPFSLRMSSMNIKNCYSCFRSSNYGWTWPICIPPVPNNKSALNIRTQIGPKGPYLPFLFFCGFGTKQQSRWPGQPKIAPGEWTHRMNKKPASSIYVTYVRTASARRRQARMADGLHHHTKLSLQAWPVRRSHANARLRWRPAKSFCGGLAGCRCNIDNTAVRCALSTATAACRARDTSYLASIHLYTTCYVIFAADDNV